MLCLAWLLSAASARAQLADDPVEVHGFVSQGFIKSTDNNYLAESERGSFEFSEAGINVTKSLTDELRVGIQLFARDLGPVGNYTARFDWYYLDYRFWDWLGIRVGRTKVPFGLYNETSDIDAARVPVLLPQSIYPTTNRDFLLAQTGGELYGYVPLAAAGQLEYRLYGGTLFFDTTEAGEEIDGVDVPYLVGGRLMWATPLDGLQLGGSVQALRLDIDYVPPQETLDALDMAGQLPADFSGTVAASIPAVLGVGSIEYSAHDLLIAAEYSRWRVSIESDLPVLIPPMTTTSERAYVMLSYHVTPWFAPGAYYSILFENVADRTAQDSYQHDVALTTRYDINDYWLFKLEGHYMHGTASLSPALNPGIPPAELAQNWGVFLAKTTAYF